jgi:hypothetical protein
MTDDYCYELTRRYSEFFKLYEAVTSCEPNSQPYSFPTKKLATSLFQLLSLASMEKVAEERRPALCSTSHPIQCSSTKSKTTTPNRRSSSPITTSSCCSSSTSNVALEVFRGTPEVLEKESGSPLPTQNPHRSHRVQTNR